MKNKSNNIRNLTVVFRVAAIALVITAAVVSCTRENRQGPTPQKLVFSVSQLTRSANYPIEEYFNISPQVRVSTGLLAAIYVYNNGMLEYDSGDVIAFPGDGSPLADLTLRWPETYTFNYDQSTESTFLSTDLLVCSFENLMPATVIPVEFNHRIYKMTFECSSSPEAIISVIIDDGTNTFNAYCDPDRTDAQLLLQIGTNLSGSTGTVMLADSMSYSIHLPDYDIDFDSPNQSITIILPF